MKPPVEPDLLGFWSRSLWIYALRIPFSMIFICWITFSQSLSPSFSIEKYILLLVASFFGLVIGAHYIDIATSREKFSPHFRYRPKLLLGAGVMGVAIGILIGIYLALRWDLIYLYPFIIIEGFAAVAYPRERPKIAHSYPAFGITWGTIPALSSYYVQAGTFSLLAIGVSIFVGVMVVMMHHLAIMTRESQDWRNALFLFDMYRYGVYFLGLISLSSLLIKA